MINRNGVNENIILAKQQFEKCFGVSNNISIAICPASVILLGDHTHYNEGILISTCVNSYWTAIIRKRKDISISFASTGSEKIYRTTLDKIDLNNNEAFILLLGLTKILYDEGLLHFGFDCVISSDVPDCLGLGSWAAMQVAFLNNLNKVFSFPFEEVQLLGLIHKNELNILGKISNIAHHYTAQFGKENKLFFMDLRSKKYQSFSFGNRNFALIVCDSGEKIIDPQKICNERIEECEVGVKGLRLYVWGIKNLRDVEEDFLLKHYHMLPKKIFSRVFYNVKERKRTEIALKFFKKNLFEKFGALISESHWGLSKDYEISGEKSDYLVTEAVKLPGTLCSKMISCSPLRCTFNFVEEKLADNFIEKINKLFYIQFQNELRIYKFRPTGGVKKSRSKS